MPYTGRMPSREAVRQAVSIDLIDAPKHPHEFVDFIIRRARQIEAGRPLRDWKDPPPERPVLVRR